MRKLVAGALAILVLAALAWFLFPERTEGYRIAMQPIKDTRAGFRMTVFEPGSSEAGARAAAAIRARDYCLSADETSNVVWRGTEESRDDALVLLGSCER
jgi:alkylhydroperoxidase family enzyme